MYESVIFCLSFCKRGATALNIAAQEGHVAILQFLLDKGAAIETKNDVRKKYIHKKTQRRNVNLAYPVHLYVLW